MDKQEYINQSFTKKVLDKSRDVENDARMILLLRQMSEKEIAEITNMAIAGTQNMIMTLIARLESKGVI